MAFIGCAADERRHAEDGEERRRDTFERNRVGQFVGALRDRDLDDARGGGRRRSRSSLNRANRANVASATKLLAFCVDRSQIMTS